MGLSSGFLSWTVCPFCLCLNVSLEFNIMISRNNYCLLYSFCCLYPFKKRVFLVFTSFYWYLLIEVNTHPSHSWIYDTKKFLKQMWCVYMLWITSTRLIQLVWVHMGHVCVYIHMTFIRSCVSIIIMYTYILRKVSANIDPLFIFVFSQKTTFQL